MKCRFSMDDIINYTEQNISDDEAAIIKEHLDSCKKCRDFYNVLTRAENLTRADLEKNYNIEGNVIAAIDSDRYKGNSILYRFGSVFSKGKPFIKVAAAIMVIFAISVTAFLIRNNSPVVISPVQTEAVNASSSPPQEVSPTPDINTGFEKKTITVYFGNSNADAIVPEKREVSVKKGDSLERIIFEELQKGPTGDNLFAVVPKDTRLLSVYTENGLCTIDLSKEFVDNSPGGTAGESMTLNSVVNSLTELPEVKKVQFLIEGQKREVYTHAIFDEPFTRNEGIIQSANGNANIETAVRTQANEVINALKNRDMDKLSTLIDPDKGVRFSPYSHVDKDKDQVFSGVQIKSIMSNKEKLFWGSYDGSGEPIELTFEEYFKKFVYDKDFSSAPDVGYNQVIGKGNTLINISEVYPEGIFMEYHFSGFDKQYEGMDWESLRLVFENKNGTWYIVGIIHDQWTI